MKYFDENYERFFKDYVSKIGIVFNKEELFQQKEEILNLLKAEGFYHIGETPIKNSYSIGNAFCHSEIGELKFFKACKYPSYNKSSYQGYPHKAWDFDVFPFDRYKSGKNEVVNPFPVEFEVKRIIEKDYPERDGAKEDYGKYGKAVELIYQFSENKNFQQTGDVSIRLLFAHLGEIYVEEGDVIKPGQVIGKVGFSGYTSFMGQHTHFEVFLFGEKVDMFEWEMVKPGIIERLSYKPLSKDKYPKDYLCPEIESKFYCWIKQKLTDGWGTHIEYKPGKQTFYVLSEKPLKNVLMYSNPWGLIKPINWEGKLGYWASYWLNKLMGKSGIYLFDICENVEIEKVTYKVYKNPETFEISNRQKTGFTEIKEKTYFQYKITVESIKPKDDIGYGLYTYYPISEDGIYGTIFTIKLRRK